MKFNDNLVTKYEYSEGCSLKDREASAIQFRANDDYPDKASVAYRGAGTFIGG